MAQFAYERVLSDANIRQAFVDEVALAAFWTIPTPQRVQTWGGQLDLNAVV